MVKDIKNYVYISIRVSIKWLITIRDYDLRWSIDVCGNKSIADIWLPKGINKAQIRRGRNTRVVAVAISRDKLPEFKQNALNHNISLGEYVRLRLLRNAYELLKARTNLFYTIKWRFSKDNPPI